MIKKNCILVKCEHKLEKEGTKITMYEMPQKASILWITTNAIPD